MWKKILAALFLTVSLWAAENPENFHRVTDDIYRSSQPDREQFRKLATDGFKSVLNLREYHSDARALRDTGITEYRLPADTGEISEAQIFEALKILRDAPRPILIHCWHGSDRTGTVVAAYRIAFENWTVERALEEMRREEFGFHERIYRNLPELLKSIDWTRMRERLFPPPEVANGK